MHVAILKMSMLSQRNTKQSLSYPSLRRYITYLVLNIIMHYSIRCLFDQRKGQWIIFHNNFESCQDNQKRQSLEAMDATPFQLNMIHTEFFQFFPFLDKNLSQNLDTC